MRPWVVVAVAAVAALVVAGVLSAFLASESLQSRWAIEGLGSSAGMKGDAFDINERGRIVGWVDAGVTATGRIVSR